MKTDTRHVDALVDRLPPVQLAALEGLLQSMLDPLSRTLALAPFDDEPFTEEDRLAVAEADKWSKHNDPIPLDAVLADFGLDMAGWDKMAKHPRGTNTAAMAKRVVFTVQAKADVRTIDRQTASKFSKRWPASPTLRKATLSACKVLTRHSIASVPRITALFSVTSAIPSNSLASAIAAMPTAEDTAASDLRTRGLDQFRRSPAPGPEIVFLARCGFVAETANRTASAREHFGLRFSVSFASNHPRYNRARIDTFGTVRDRGVAVR
ncbi:MAG: hypothetical protein ABSH09_08910 [Bryobacteraceae bacterium]|jgi:hypothetical protein